MSRGWGGIVSPILSAHVEAMSKRGLGDLEVDLYGCDAHRDVLVAFAYCECRRRFCPFCGRWQRGRRRARCMELARRLRAVGGPLLHVTLDSAPVRETAAAVRARAKALLIAARGLFHGPFGREHIRGARVEVDFSDAHPSPGLHLHLHVLVVGNLDPIEHLDDLRTAWEAALRCAAGESAINRGRSPVLVQTLPSVEDAMRVHEYASKGFLFDPESPSYRYYGTLATDAELSITTDEYVPGHPGNRVVPGRGAAQWRAVERGLLGADLTRAFGVLRGTPNTPVAGEAIDRPSPAAREAEDGDTPEDQAGLRVFGADEDHDIHVGLVDDEPVPSAPSQVEHAHDLSAVSLRDCPRCYRPLSRRGHTSARRFLRLPEAADYRVECIPPLAALRVTTRTSPRVAVMATKIVPSPDGP